MGTKRSQKKRRKGENRMEVEVANILPEMAKAHTLTEARNDS